MHVTERQECDEVSGTQAYAFLLSSDSQTDEKSKETDDCYDVETKVKVEWIRSTCRSVGDRPGPE